MQRIWTSPEITDTLPRPTTRTICTEELAVCLYQNFICNRNLVQGNFVSIYHLVHQWAIMLLLNLMDHP